MKTIKRIYFWLMGLPLAVSLGMFGCAPAKAPTALDVAQTAVVLTDDALAAYMTAKPTTAETLVVREDYVRWLERAATAVRKRQDVCPALPALIVVATAVDCAKCRDAIALAQKGLSCPQ